MNPRSPEEIDRLLQELQSKAFARRKAAAEQLGQVKLRPEDHPQISAEKLTEFNSALQRATAQAVDPIVLKQALSLPRLVPGVAPLLVCLVAQIIGLIPRGPIGGVLWAVVTIFLGFWYVKCLSAGIATLTAPAARLAAQGREIGLFKKMNPMDEVGLESPPMASETAVKNELRARLSTLRPVTTTAIEEALASVHFTGSHWISRTMRTRGSLEEVCQLAAEIVAAYRTRCGVENLRWDQLGPLNSRNMDHVWLLIVTPTAAVPFLVLRIGEGAYWVAHFPPGQ